MFYISQNLAILLVHNWKELRVYNINFPNTNDQKSGFLNLTFLNIRDTKLYINVPKTMFF